MDAILKTLKSKLRLFVLADRLKVETLWYLTALTTAEIDNNVNEIENIIRKISAQTLVDSLETENLYFGVHLEDIRTINSDVLKSIFEQHHHELQSLAIAFIDRVPELYANELYLRSRANREAVSQLRSRMFALGDIQTCFKYYEWLMIGECCFENEEYDCASEAYNCAASAGRRFRQNHFQYEAELHYKMAICYFNLSKYDKSLEMLKKCSEFIELKSRTLDESNGGSRSQTETDTLRILNEIVEDKKAEVVLKLGSFNDKI